MSTTIAERGTRDEGLGTSDPSFLDPRHSTLDLVPFPHHVIDNWAEAKRWTPSMDEDERARLYRNWKKAVTRTFDWVDDDVN